MRKTRSEWAIDRHDPGRANQKPSPSLELALGDVAPLRASPSRPAAPVSRTNRPDKRPHSITCPDDQKFLANRAASTKEGWISGPCPPRLSCVRSRADDPLFSKTGRGAVRLQECAVHHQRVALSAWLRQLLKYSGEDAHPGPAGEPVIQGLIRAIDRWRILPAKTVSLDIDDAAQHLAIVRSGTPSRFGKEGLNASHLLRAQPEVSCIALVHDQHESVNMLACKKDL